MVERLAAQEGISLRSRESLSRVARGTVEGQRVLLALPQTMMNASGEAVAALCKSNGIEPSEICVVLDEVELPLGALRLRPRGSAGGHNGMVSIISALGTNDFPRLAVNPKNGHLYATWQDYQRRDNSTREFSIQMSTSADGGLICRAGPGSVRPRRRAGRSRPLPGSGRIAAGHGSGDGPGAPGR